MPRKQLKVFTNKDFECPNGFCTKIFGPIFWAHLHFISFNYPNNPTDEQKTHYYIQVTNLQHVLPCKACRVNMKMNLEKMPLRLKDLKNRKTFSKWVYSFHELVNKMLKKKSGLTYEEVRERYEHFRARCDGKTQKGVEEGCLHTKSGIECKTIIAIVPDSEDLNESFYVDPECLWRKM